MASQARHTVAFVVERTPIVLTLFVSAVLIGAAVQAAIGWAGDLRAATVDRSDIFEYVAVEYVRADDDAMVIRSTRAIHRDVEAMSFVDVLRCSGIIYSTYSSTVPSVEASGLGSLEWTYPAPFPTDGRTCVLVAQVTAEYRGRLYTQRLESVPFNPTKENDA